MGIPDNEYDAVNVIKQGFVYEFLQVALVKPIFNIKEPGKLAEWYRNRDKPGTVRPEPEEIFKARTFKVLALGFVDSDYEMLSDMDGNTVFYDFYSADLSVS